MLSALLTPGEHLERPRDSGAVKKAVVWKLEGFSLPELREGSSPSSRPPWTGPSRHVLPRLSRCPRLQGPSSLGFPSKDRNRAGRLVAPSQPRGPNWPSPKPPRPRPPPLSEQARQGRAQPRGGAGTSPETPRPGPPGPPIRPPPSSRPRPQARPGSGPCPRGALVHRGTGCGRLPRELSAQRCGRRDILLEGASGALASSATWTLDRGNIIGVPEVPSDVQRPLPARPPAVNLAPPGL